MNFKVAKNVETITEFINLLSMVERLGEQISLQIWIENLACDYSTIKIEDIYFDTNRQNELKNITIVVKDVEREIIINCKEECQVFENEFDNSVGYEFCAGQYSTNIRVTFLFSEEILLQRRREKDSGK